MSDEELSQRLRRIKGLLQASSSKQSADFEASTSTPYPIYTRLDLTQSVEVKQKATSSSSSDLSHHPDLNEMANNNRTLKELVAPDFDQQPLCIEYPQLEVAFELKSGMIHLLPTFQGFAGEDPNKHLKEFHVVCSSMKPTRIFEKQVTLRAFLFSLADSAKEWLYYLPSSTITTWNEMKKLFLEK